jgi:hypothetical protein
VDRVVDRYGHALCPVRHGGGVEHGAEELRIAVELEREIHLAARQAIEAREEVLGVLHPAWVSPGAEEDRPARRRFPTRRPARSRPRPICVFPCSADGHGSSSRARSMVWIGRKPRVNPGAADAASQMKSCFS